MTTPLPKIAEVLRSLADNTVTGLPTFCWACGQQDWVQPCRKCLRIAADALDAAGRLPRLLEQHGRVDFYHHQGGFSLRGWETNDYGCHGSIELGRGPTIVAALQAVGAKAEPAPPDAGGR